jgi:hypothetical protein
MEKWIKEIVLETNNIKLVPIRENHSADLIKAATDGNLCELWFTTVPTKNNINNYIAKAIEDYKEDKGLAFVVIDKKNEHSNW